MATDIPYVASGETPHEPVTSQGVIEASAWDHWVESRALIMEAPLPEAAKQRLIDSLGPEPPIDAKIQLDYEGNQVLEQSSQLTPAELLPPDREPELAADDGMEINENAINETMPITRTSMITGITHTRDLPVTQEQIDRWQNGEALIQDAMPQLSNPDREFVKTGITPEEWIEEFGLPDADEPDFDLDDDDIYPF